MALNVVNNSDNLQFPNNQYTIYKNVPKLPLISLQTNKNFTLIQNKKGKVLNKPVFSGYTKNKFSSIPRDVEIILLNKDKDELLFKNDKSLNTSKSKDYIFNNNIYINPYAKNNLSTLKEKARCASSQVSSHISDNINNKTILPISTNNSKNTSTIKIRKKKIIDNTKTPNYWRFYKRADNNINDLSNSQNNLSFDEYKSQFYPGPSEYNVEKSFEKINLQNKFRYKSLFKCEINKHKKNKDNSPGPGSYLKINNILNNNNKHLSINLGTKEKRFKNLFNSNNPLSPWYYSTSNNSQNNKNNAKINKNNNNNHLDGNNYNSKDSYDYRYYIIKEEISDKGEKKQFYIEDINHKINNNSENSTKIITKPFNNKIFNKKRQFNNLLKKYINTNENKAYEIPGPGQYNIYIGFDKMLKDNAIERLKNINKQEKFIPENVLKEFSLSKNSPGLYENESFRDIKKKGMNASKSCENIFIQETTKSGNGTLPFLSKKKRIEFHDDLLLKHTPGPCYYYNNSSSQTYTQNKKLKHSFKN